MTLSLVAKSAGVSKSTVSRVLNGKPGPSLTTVRKVMRTAERLGYRPAPPGHRPGLRRRQRQSVRHELIALLMLDDGFQRHGEQFAKLSRGVVQAAETQGIGVLLGMPGVTGQLPAAVLQGRIDGLLLAGSYPKDSIIQALPPVPKVWVTSRQQQGGDQILLGNEAAGVLAAKHLLLRVEGPVACFNPVPLHPALRRRCDAFEFTVIEQGRRCLRIEGQEPPHPLLDGVAWDPMAARMGPLVNHLLDESPVPQGLFVPSDLWCAVAHMLLRDRQALPEHIVSCGNETAYLTGLSPRPATIDLAQDLIGHHAVEQLVRRIESPEQSVAVALALDPNLIA